jgi:hypothetical protein
MKSYFAPWQNPLYPQDQWMTTDEIEQAARAASMARAQSPGPLTCLIDGTWSVDDPMHADDFVTCMQYRHQNVVADGDPWTYWELVDGPLIGPRPPVPLLPVGLEGWQIRAFAGDLPPGFFPPPNPLPPIPPNPKPIPRVWAVRASSGVGTPPVFPSGHAGWNGWTANIGVNPWVITKGLAIPAFATRLTLCGSFTVQACYMGVIDPKNNLFATRMYQFTFNGKLSDDGVTFIPGDTFATANLDDTGNFIPLVTDPLPVGFDGTSGFYISLYFDPSGNGAVGENPGAGGWVTKSIQGNHAAEIDKSNLFMFGNNVAVAVLTIEGLYDQSQLPKPPSTTPPSTTPPPSPILPTR